MTLLTRRSLIGGLGASGLIKPALGQGALILATPPAALAPPLDGLANLTGAWSFSRKLLTAYGGPFADNPVTTTLYNQQGTANRDMAQSASRMPGLTYAGPRGQACGGFDGVDDCLVGQSGTMLSSLMSASSGYVIISGIFRTLTLNVAPPLADRNHRLLIDTGDFMGVMGRSGGIVYGFNWDGAAEFATSASSAIVAGTPYVFEWYHSGGNVGLSINNATDLTTASGNTSNLGGALSIGGLNSGTGAFDGYIFELASFSALPSSGIRSALVSNFRTWIGA